MSRGILGIVIQLYHDVGLNTNFRSQDKEFNKLQLDHVAPRAAIGWVDTYGGISLRVYYVKLISSAGPPAAWRYEYDCSLFEVLYENGAWKVSNGGQAVWRFGQIDGTSFGNTLAAVTWQDPNRQIRIYYYAKNYLSELSWQGGTSWVESKQWPKGSGWKVGIGTIGKYDYP